MLLLAVIFRALINVFWCVKAECFVPSRVLYDSSVFWMSSFKGTNIKGQRQPESYLFCFFE